MRCLHFYCSEARNENNYVSCKAALLSPMRIHDLDTEQFSAVLLNGHSTLPVECQVVTITEMASGQTEQGAPATLFNGEACHYDPIISVISASQNEANLICATENHHVDNQFIITTYKQSVINCYNVVIELLCQTFAELPDFIANLSYLRSFEESLISPEFAERFLDVHDLREYPRYSDTLNSYAQSTQLGQGLVLPVSHPGASGVQAGALIIGSKLPSSTSRFFAKLYMINNYEIRNDIILMRAVESGDAARRETQSRLVARIEAIIDQVY